MYRGGACAGRLPRCTGDTDRDSAKDLPAGSVIGTSSLRRELQIKAMNPFVEIRMLRGNVPTRLQKLKDGQYDGIILAAAGLKRLHLEKEDGLFYEYFQRKTFYRQQDRAF